MAIGYACIQLGKVNTKLSTIYVKNFDQEKFEKIVENNLNALESILKYNIKNNIKLFRISSDIIPLSTHPINNVCWQEIFKDKLFEIGKLIKNNDIRVTMHPGQYTVLNSPNEEVVKKAIEDLSFHNEFLDSLNCDYSSKMVLHIGGVYSDKKSAIERFITNFEKLDNNIKNRLIIENDDKSYNIDDVLYISSKINIPVVFDNLHHRLNPPKNNSLNQYELIEKCNLTWKDIDGKQKIHYSQSANNFKNGAHSQYIKANDFLDFYNNLINKDIDIMLEVKDKNLSALKCNLLTKENLKIQELETEWARYKYYVLSASASIYQEIRTLLKDKKNYDALSFYNLIEKAIDIENHKPSQINTLTHIWGYFKKIGTEGEKKKFFSLLNDYQDNKKSITPIKNYIFKLSYKYDIDYLLESLYFYL